MMEKFRKDQIVPRRIHIVEVNKQKVRHLWKFGFDIIVNGKEITAISEGPILVFRRDYINGRKGKPREYCHSLIEGVYFKTFSANEVKE